MNVVVIVTDSLRADHLGCHPKAVSYHGKKIQTPNLDRLAAEGVLFTRAFSESLPTMPTRHTWWTGRVQFPFRGWQPFENSDYLLAEVLWDRGYTSALITDTYHMHKPVYNCGRGFDTVVWVRGQEYDPWIVDDRPVDLGSWHRLRGDQSDSMWRERFEQVLAQPFCLSLGGRFLCPSGDPRGDPLAGAPGSNEGDQGPTLPLGGLL
ncbi:MAG: hypothetical protein KatS3mg115_2528 [Candidatus Poribacteria bacterium]|nr:MAG: hypothetical protein KatS3mg115_2528 [Candidatus Poribacteria bacterium]